MYFYVLPAHVFTLFALFLPTVAQNSSSTDYLNSVEQALQNAGLTSFAATAMRLANTSIIQNLLTVLPGGNFTLFVPNNQACESDSAKFFYCFEQITSHQRSRVGLFQ